MGYRQSQESALELSSSMACKYVVSCPDMLSE
jgi:hypothetical protein